MASPDFIIPGASRAGTTSLHYYLSEHDNIFMAESKTGKELRFFSNDSEYSKGLDYYESYFDGATNEYVLGEKSPAYFRKGTVWSGDNGEEYNWQPHDDVPTRIHDAYPDIKLIITLRNPVTRAYSQYQKNYRQGRETAPSFHEAIHEELKGKRQIEETQYCWLFQNRYPLHLNRWLELFSEENIQFLVFERWINNPEPTLNEICRFLGVDPLTTWSRSEDVKNVGGRPRFVSINRFYQRYIEGTPLSTLLRRTRITHIVDRLNSKEGYPEMTTEEWHLAKDVFGDVIDKTEKVIGQDLDVWREEIEENLQE